MGYPVRHVTIDADNLQSLPGKGIGSLVTGKLFDPVSGLGEVWTFRLYSFLALSVLLVYAAVNLLFFRHRQNPAELHSDKGEKQSGNCKNFWETKPSNASEKKG